MPDFTGKYDRGLRAHPEVLGNLTNVGSFFGKVPMTSNSVQVACTLVGTLSMIRTSVQLLGPVSSGVPMIGVQSLAPGVGFTLGAVASFNLGTTVSLAVWWELVNPKPAGTA